MGGVFSKEDCDEMLSGFQADGEEKKEQVQLQKLSFCNRDGVKMVKEGKPDKAIKMILGSTFRGKGEAAKDCAKFLNTDAGAEYFAEKQQGGEMSEEEKAEMRKRRQEAQ